MRNENNLTGHEVAIILALLVIIGLCVFSIVSCAKYGNKPITEVPSWYYFWMMGGKR